MKVSVGDAVIQVLAAFRGGDIDIYTASSLIVKILSKHREITGWPLKIDGMTLREFRESAE